MDCRRLRIISLIFALFFLGGCGLFRDGGAPPASFDVNEDIRQLKMEYDKFTVTGYYAVAEDNLAARRDYRDKFITGRLVLMNVHYIEFVRTMTADRQAIDSASDLLVLSLTLAGSTSTGEAAKILSAVAAGVTGGSAVLDKYYFYEKTVPALVAAMNAQRKAALIPILTGMQQDIKAYPLAAALSDLNTYYHAGTFIGAIAAIQADAGAKEARSDGEILDIRENGANSLKSITYKSKSGVARKGAVGEWRAPITKAINAITDAAVANRLLKKLDLLSSNELNVGAAPVELSEAKRRLRDKNRRATTDGIIQILQAFDEENVPIGDPEPLEDDINTVPSPATSPVTTAPSTTGPGPN